MSELQANRATFPAPTTSDDPQSSGQSAGFAGGVHVLSTMSHRALSALTAHEMFIDGVLNHVGDVMTTSDVEVVGAAVVEGDGCVVDVPDDEPPAHEESPSTTTINTPATPFRTRGPYARRPLRVLNPPVASAARASP